MPRWAPRALFRTLFGLGLSQHDWHTKRDMLYAHIYTDYSHDCDWLWVFNQLILITENKILRSRFRSSLNDLSNSLEYGVNWLTDCRNHINARVIIIKKGLPSVKLEFIKKEKD